MKRETSPTILMAVNLPKLSIEFMRKVILCTIDEGLDLADAGISWCQSAKANLCVSRLHFAGEEVFAKLSVHARTSDFLLEEIGEIEPNAVNTFVIEDLILVFIRASRNRSFVLAQFSEYEVLVVSNALIHLEEGMVAVRSLLKAVKQLVLLEPEADEDTCCYQHGDYSEDFVLVKDSTGVSTYEENEATVLRAAGHELEQSNEDQQCSHTVREDRR